MKDKEIEVFIAAAPSSVLHRSPISGRIDQQVWEHGGTLLIATWHYHYPDGHRLAARLKGISYAYGD